MNLLVNEIFESIQGEASFAGAPSVFVRLQGCCVGCPWCDTKHTWATRPEDETSLGAVLDKSGDAGGYAAVDVDDLTDLLVSRFRARHVVITGGEPALYDLTRLSSSLLALGRSVQLETSGTEALRIDAGAWVTVSPKISMPGGREVRGDVLARADEIKMPVGKPADIDELVALLARHGVTPATPIWLQPLSMSSKATALCMEAVIARQWRLSVQVHKFLGAR